MPRSLSAEDREEESDTDENYHLPRSVSMQYSIDENHNKDYHGNEEPIGKHGKHDDLSPYVIGQSRNGICMLYNSKYSVNFRNNLTQGNNQSRMFLASSHRSKNMNLTKSLNCYYRRPQCELLFNQHK